MRLCTSRGDPEEVDAFAAVRGTGTRASLSEGELAARVFELFEQGRPLERIVIELRQPPRVIRALYREWGTPLFVGEAKRQQEERANRARAAEDRENKERRRSEKEFERSLRRIATLS